MDKICFAIFCFGGPLLVLWLTQKSDVLNKIGSIILAYAVGIVVGLVGLFPETEEFRTFQSTIAAVSVPLAIPLMLLSANVRAWSRLAPSFIKSLLAGIVACLAAVTIGFLIFGQDDSQTFSHIGGMLTGLYTGGTANLASLKVALGVSDSVYLQVHTYSIVVSSIYLVFVIMAGQRVLGLFMPHFDHAKDRPADLATDLENHDSELFLGLFSRDNRKDLLKGLGITLGIIVLGAALALLAPSNAFQAVFIMLISLFAIFLASSKRVRAIKRTFELGTYFILVFSFAVSSQVSTAMFTDIDMHFFYFTLVVTLGSLLIHIVLNTLMRVDVDTTLVTSISLICSPPFVPVLTSALHNRAVLGPGIAVGLIGYSIGTYLGFTVAYTLPLLANG